MCLSVYLPCLSVSVCPSVIPPYTFINVTADILLYTSTQLFSSFFRHFFTVVRLFRGIGVIAVFLVRFGCVSVKEMESVVDTYLGIAFRTWVNHVFEEIEKKR